MAVLLRRSASVARQCTSLRVLGPPTPLHAVAPKMTITSVPIPTVTLSLAPLHLARRQQRPTRRPLVHSLRAHAHPQRRHFSSSRRFSERETDVLRVLQGVSHPTQGRDIVDIGLVKDVAQADGKVELTLDLDKDYRKVKQLAIAAIESLPWVKGVNVKMFTPPKPAAGTDAKTNAPPPGLEKVKNIVAVSSCKGGVGKSTVAINLAYSLSNLGLRVGIFDADIYGPSLPTMVSTMDDKIYQTPDGRLEAPVFENVKLMSYGFVKGKAAVMRGPMVSQLVHQLVSFTDWGELDYLIVDMPPGTGDIQLTLSQQVQLTGAVIVTTPQQLSFIDVVKGIELFDRVKVPILGVVENMASFTCGNCSTVHHPFGPSVRKALSDQFGIKQAYELPILRHIAMNSDRGTPVALDHDPATQAVRKVYLDIARGVTEQVEVVRQGLAIPSVVWNDDTKLIEVTHANKTIQVQPRELRLKCGCAACIEEFSGRSLLHASDVPEDVHPTAIRPKGNYAVAVVWSDGHNSSIYPYEKLVAEDST